jgi:dihydrofolate synthase/folylpolyglutamate synthase
MRDKDAEAMLSELAPLAATAVVTTASNPRALPAEELAVVARRHVASVESSPDPAEALHRARALAGPDGRVLVTGSLYLLADLQSVT